MSSAPAPHSIGPVRTLSGTIRPAPYPSHSPQRQVASGQNENFWPSSPSGQQLSRNSSGQSFGDPSPSASGQFPSGSNQYASGPSAENGDFSMMGRRAVPRQATPEERAAQADSLANHFQLSDQNRIQLHRLSQEDPSADLAINASLMGIYSQFRVMKRQYDEVVEKLVAIQERTTAGWTMSKEQEDILKEIINHWLTKPVNGYGKALNRSIDKYIKQNAEKLHLKLYITDAVIRRTVERFVNTHQTTQRGNNLRGLGEAISRGDSLEEYCTRMLNLYAYGADTAPTNAVRGQFALMRFIYRDIQVNGRNGKGDPGFWKELDTELTRLVQVNGKDRKSVKWEAWYLHMIEEDIKLFATVEPDVLPGLNLEGEVETDDDEAVEVETVQA